MVGPTPPPTRGRDGAYEVASSDLKRVDSLPTFEVPRELSIYEFSDSVDLAVTISPEGRVKKVKALSGKSEALKDTAEKTVKKWTFQPYLVNGISVTIRTEIALEFDNTFDRYREPNGDVPVRLDENAARARVVKSVPPEYPSDAAVARIQGRVSLRIIIGEDGNVHAVHIIRGHPMLAPAAYNAVRKWKFNPYVENGKRLPVDTNLNIDFTL